MSAQVYSRVSSLDIRDNLPVAFGDRGDAQGLMTFQQGLDDLPGGLIGDKHYERSAHSNTPDA